MALTTTDDVRGRLAERASAAGADPGSAPTSPAQMVRTAIEKQATAFKAVLPSVVDPERFGRLVLTAIKGAPDLMECFATPQGQTSVLLAAMQAAAIGLEPNTPTQDCWLLPRRDRRAGTMECQLSIGYRGYMKLARRSGNIETMFAEVVRERDHFIWRRGLAEDVFEHEPAPGTDEQRGPLVAAYAVARYKSGGYSFVVLSAADIEARRAQSDSWKSERSRPYSPWTKWPAAMWKKSAVRALVPYLDLSADVERSMASDEARISIDDESGLIDITSQPFELGAGDDEPVSPPPADLASVPDGDPFTADDDVAEAVLVDDPMTDGQRKALHALLRSKHGATGDARFPVLSQMLGREITSTNEISKVEAGALIDEMQSEPEHAA